MQLCWEFFPVNRPSLKELRLLMNELQRSGGARIRPIPATGPWNSLHPLHVNDLDEKFALHPQLLESLQTYRKRMGQAEGGRAEEQAATAALIASTVGTIEHT